MTYLAVPIAANSVVQGLKQVQHAFSDADMVELRADYLEGLSSELVREFVAGARGICGDAVSLILTCRDKNEGGCIEYPEELRLEAIEAGLESAVDFVDFEYANFLSMSCRDRILGAMAGKGRGRLILSAHDFQGRFENITQLYRQIKSHGDWIIPKLVYTAGHINDCFEAFDLLHNTSGDRIVLCMGQAGLVSRLAAGRLGGFLTFASLDVDIGTAPGQVSIEEMKRIYRVDKTNAETELFGVIGSPVGHSLSPAVHNACFDAIGVNNLYMPLLVSGGRAEFDAFMHNVLSRDWLGFRGFSVTIPHKGHALENLGGSGQFVEPLAASIGAVNTIKIGYNGRVSGYNTDYAGAMNALASALGIKKHQLHQVKVAVIGAGGVSRAVVAGLSDVGAKVTIYNRTVEKARQLSAEFHCEYAPLDALREMDAQIVINCTSIGMYPNVDVSPVPAKCLKSDMAVFDTVYNPAETLLLRQSREAGAVTVDGVSMFVGQALAQFKIFTGKDADANVMRKIICESL